jgi:cobalt-precorrin 5A hydrolase
MGKILETEQHTAQGTQHHSVAVVAMTRNGVNLALQIQARLPGSICYVPRRHRFALDLGAVGFDRLREVVPLLWHQYRHLVFIMATGIVVRQIAALLNHKSIDPAVVVLDERGKYAISLVSGHLGGANRLAETIAAITNGQPVITTASDVQNRPAIDLIALELGLVIENSQMLSSVARSLLEEEAVWVVDPERRLEPYLKSELNTVRLDDQAIEPYHNRTGVGIWVSEYQPPEGVQCLMLRPRNLVVGVGCNRGASAEEILGLLSNTFERERLALLSIRNLASIDLKSDEGGILEAGRVLGRPVYFYSRQDIEKMAVPNPSRVVLACIGVESVCEATALLSAQSSELIIAKRKTANVTIAVARAAFPS